MPKAVDISGKDQVNERTHLQDALFPMGSCLSCCGLVSDDDRDDAQISSERTPLLQDPSAVLGQPRPEPNPEDEQREQEILAKIVNRTSESLIDIQSTFDKRGNGADDQAQKIAHFEYLLERLQNEGRLSQPLSSYRTNGGTDADSFSELVPPDRAVPEDVTAPNEPDMEPPQVLTPVGNIVVRLSWT